MHKNFVCNPKIPPVLEEIKLAGKTSTALKWLALLGIPATAAAAAGYGIGGYTDFNPKAVVNPAGVKLDNFKSKAKDLSSTVAPTTGYYGSEDLPSTAKLNAWKKKTQLVLNSSNSLAYGGSDSGAKRFDYIESLPDSAGVYEGKHIPTTKDRYNNWKTYVSNMLKNDELSGRVDSYDAPHLVKTSPIVSEEEQKGFSWSNFIQGIASLFGNGGK